MKRQALLGLRFPNFEDSSFWRRCSCNKSVLFLLFFTLVLGVFSGSLFACFSFQDKSLLPLFFSGVPTREAGFISCFSTFLVSQLIFLTAAFLFGITAFGFFAIPCLAFFRGTVIGLGCSAFLWEEGLLGLGISAVIYLPATTLSFLLFFLFLPRAMSFSEKLRKSGFSTAVTEHLDFSGYWKDALCFLIFSMATSFLGGMLAILGTKLFSLAGLSV